MPKLNAGLLAAIFIILLIDMTRSREPFDQLREGMRQLEGSVKQLSQQQARLRDQLARLTDGLEAGTIARSGDSAIADERDGQVKLGRNFLLPYDRSVFDPSQVGGTLREFSSEPSSFNDILQSMAVTSDANSLVNDSLCAHPSDQPHLWQSELATACVIEDDYTTFTFKIRPGVLWQIPPQSQEPGLEWLDQQAELTAHDFVFVLSMIMNPEVEAGHLRVYYEDLESWEAIDDYTLRLKWSKKLHTNLGSSLSLSPAPRHVYTRYRDGSEIPEELVPVVFNEHWFDRGETMGLIGVGRYQMVDFTPGKGVLFRRNSAYWGATYHFEEIFWDTEVTDRAARLTAFKNNQAHFQGLTPNQYKSQIIDRQEPRFAAPDEDAENPGWEGPFGWEIVKSNSYSGIAWNMRRPELRDRAVRQALAHLFPTDRVLSEVFFGLGEAKLGPVHPDSPYYNETLDPYRFGIDRAVQLLDEAGWSDSDGDGWRDKMIDGVRVPLSIDITYYGPIKTWENLVSLFAAEAKKAGVEIVPSPVEAKEWERRANDRDFDGFTVGWRSGDLEIDFYQLWHSKGANDPTSSNYPGFANARVDELADELRRTFPIAERTRIAKEVQAILHEEQPYLFVRASEGVFAWHHRRQGPQDDREVLDGVTWGLQHYHPLFNRDRSPWHFSRFAGAE